MDADGEELITALVRMAAQYLGEQGSDDLDTLSMSAGEMAVEVLAKHGMVELPDPDHLRIARWTAAGLRRLQET